MTRTHKSEQFSIESQLIRLKDPN